MVRVQSLSELNAILGLDRISLPFDTRYLKWSFVFFYFTGKVARECGVVDTVAVGADPVQRGRRMGVDVRRPARRSSGVVFGARRVRRDVHVQFVPF